LSRKDYLREWRKKNPENVKQHKRNYYSKNKEKERRKSSERYFRGFERMFGLRYHYCTTCNSDVHWNHEHFDPPKVMRYNHKVILPEYKEEYRRRQDMEYEFMSKLFSFVRKSLDAKNEPDKLSGETL